MAVAVGSETGAVAGIDWRRESVEAVFAYCDVQSSRLPGDLISAILLLGIGASNLVAPYTLL